MLKDSIDKCEIEMDFIIIAFIAMPDHLHMIIDPKENNLSSIMQKIKLSFSKKYRFEKGKTTGNVWQSRFWDHLIRNQEDLNRHIDYIHYNPVKHGFTKSPFDWPESSIHEYYKNGHYDREWGSIGPLKLDGDFGE